MQKFFVWFKSAFIQKNALFLYLLSLMSHLAFFLEMYIGYSHYINHMYKQLKKAINKKNCSDPHIIYILETKDTI